MAVYTSQLLQGTITWQNYNGTVLQTKTYLASEGEPSYSGSTPSRSDYIPSSGTGTRYTFSGWTLISSSGLDKTYRASFSSRTLYIWDRYSVEGTGNYYKEQCGTAEVEPLTPTSSHHVTSFGIINTKSIMVQVNYTHGNYDIDEYGRFNYVGNPGYTRNIFFINNLNGYDSVDISPVVLQNTMMTSTMRAGFNIADNRFEGGYEPSFYNEYDSGKDETYLYAHEIRLHIERYNSSYGYECSGEIIIYRVAEEMGQGSTKYSYVTSTSSSAYPSNGASGSYWYVRR